MIVDHTYTIGKGHQFCEDYACSKEQLSPFIIVSDGCSSSPFTDIGARIQVHAAKRYLEEMLKWHSPEVGRMIRSHLPESIYQANQRILMPLDIPTAALDATLLIAYVVNNGVYVLCYGDGYIILKYKNGSVITYELSYTQNAPIYINVFYDLKRMENYSDIHLYLKSDEYPDKVQCTEPWYFNTFPTTDFNSGLSAIYLSTDGLGTFCGKDGATIPQARIIEEVTKIKIPTRNFLKRRVHSMQTMFQGEGIANYDDLGIAAILFD